MRDIVFYPASTARPKKERKAGDLFSRCVAIMAMCSIIFFPLAPVRGEEASPDASVDVSEVIQPTGEINETAEDGEKILSELPSEQVEQIELVPDENPFSEEQSVESSSGAENAVPEPKAEEVLVENNGETQSVVSSEETSSEPDPLINTEESGGSTGSLSATSSSSEEPAVPREEENRSSAPEDENEPILEAQDASTPYEDLTTEELSAKLKDQEARYQEELERKNRVIEELTENATQRPRREAEKELQARCVALAHGYFCLDGDGAASSGEVLASPSDNGFLRAERVSGNYEIYLTGASGEERITENDYDDIFPERDRGGAMIVWQGNPGGTWQIFVKNGLDPVEQLTNTNDSNMNPRVSSDFVVWQGWRDGNWEIFLAEKKNNIEDGATSTVSKESWSVERLTTNITNDMFPSIARGLVTWQSWNGSGWEILVYDIKNKKIEKLEGSGVAESPRFALIAEERNTDGTFRTVGYDLASGRKLELHLDRLPITIPVDPPAPPLHEQDGVFPAPSGGHTEKKVEGGEDGATPE